MLITSRNPHWSDLAHPLEVKVFQRDESVRFLCHRTGRNPGGETEAASRLADALGDLPLALEQAAAYIAVTSLTFEAYLGLYQTRHEALWRKEKSPLAYSATVATTWNLAMEKASEECVSSAELLNLCAYLGAEAIPRSLLSEGHEQLPASLSSVVTDALEFSSAIVALGRYSLIGVDSASFSLHRLVQSVVRDQLSRKARKHWSQSAVCLVNEA